MLAFCPATGFGGSDAGTSSVEASLDGFVTKTSSSARDSMASSIVSTVRGVFAPEEGGGVFFRPKIVENN